MLPIVPQISPEKAAIQAVEMRKQVFDNIALEKTSKNNTAKQEQVLINN